MPYDLRIPKIRISTRQANLLRSHRIVVHIDSWLLHSQYPDGHFVRSIGPIGDIETETAVIMIEHGLLCPSFNKELLNGQLLLNGHLIANTLLVWNMNSFNNTLCGTVYLLGFIVCVFRTS